MIRLDNTPEQAAWAGEQQTGRTEFDYPGKLAGDKHAQHNQLSHGRGGGGSDVGRSLTSSEVESVGEYRRGMYNSKVGGYTTIQKHLRTDAEIVSGNAVDKPAVKAIVADIDSAMSVSRGADGRTLMRGISDSKAYFGKPARDVKVGDVFTDKGYISTTTSRAIAKKFVDPFYEPRRAARNSSFLKIKTTADTPSIDMNKALSKSKENEVLLPRGMQFKVTAVNFRKAVPEITMEVMPDA